MSGVARRGLFWKARMAARIWTSYAVVRYGLRRWKLPELVERLGGARRGRGDSADAAASVHDRVGRMASVGRIPGDPATCLAPQTLGRLVDRALRVGPFRPRCLYTSLVLYRLLRRRGDRPQLVIGLPLEAEGHEAHAWVEIDRAVVGPPPGRLDCTPLARYGGSNGATGTTRREE